MAKRKPIPYAITFNKERSLTYVEAWFDGNQKDAGTGYERSFSDCDFARAACYVSELQRGIVSGKY